MRIMRCYFPNLPVLPINLVPTVIVGIRVTSPGDLSWSTVMIETRETNFKPDATDNEKKIYMQNGPISL